MLLRERPIAAIGERCDPGVLDATTWRVSGRRQNKTGKSRQQILPIEFKMQKGYIYNQSNPGGANII